VKSKLSKQLLTELQTAVEDGAVEVGDPMPPQCVQRRWIAVKARVLHFKERWADSSRLGHILVFILEANTIQALPNLRYLFFYL
jgi:hypothetical protein